MRRSRETGNDESPALSVCVSGAFADRGDLFGFFYAWVCSTMWGLDSAHPVAAITAMQAMNASVRNAVFAPAFFGTSVALFITALLAFRTENRSVSWAFGAAGAVYLFGSFLPTVTVNVPMNGALAQVRLPLDVDEAKTIWVTYSAPWQRWNLVRTCASGLSLLLVGFGIYRIGVSRLGAP